MDSILILIKSESRFPIDRKRIRNLAERVLHQNGIVSDSEVSLIFVGERKMKRLNRDYRQINQTTSVLAFSQLEKKGSERFIMPPDGILRLGDVVICYPEAQKLANKEKVLVDDEIDGLLEHGLLNLIQLKS